MMLSLIPVNVPHFDESADYRFILIFHLLADFRRNSVDSDKGITLRTCRFYGRSIAVLGVYIGTAPSNGPTG